MKTKVSTRRKGADRIHTRWTDRAVQDLEAIGDFIAADSPIAAERWVAKLVSAAENIAKLPLAGRRVPEVGRDDVREILLRNYRIVYRFHEGMIAILTIFEGHRQLPSDALDSER